MYKCSVHMGYTYVVYIQCVHTCSCNMYAMYLHIYGNAHMYLYGNGNVHMGMYIWECTNILKQCTNVVYIWDIPM